MVKVKGKAHADAAAMVIIKAVWQALRGAGETYHSVHPEKDGAGKLEKKN